MPLLPELEMLFGPGSTKMSSLTGLKTCRGLGHLKAECRMQNADCGFRRRDADGDDRVGCVTTADGGERSARAPTATCEAHVLPGPGCSTLSSHRLDATTPRATGSTLQARRYNPSSHRLDATTPRATGSTLHQIRARPIFQQEGCPASSAGPVARRDGRVARPTPRNRQRV
jgi:hypothetical protein